MQEDYELLAEMNNVTATKYSDMRQIASKVTKQMEELNSKCKSFYLVRVFTIFVFRPNADTFHRQKIDPSTRRDYPFAK